MQDFDSIAKDFDTKMRLQRAVAISDEIRKHIIDGHTKTAIDYGCGTGLIGLNLVDDFQNIIFTDSSTGMIEQIQQKIEAQNLTHCSAVEYDFIDNTPDNLKVDYIFSSLVLHHILDTQKIFECFYKILNKDGHIVIVDLDKEDGSFHAEHNDFEGHNGFDQDYIIEAAKQAGFKFKNISTFFHGIKKQDIKDSEYSLFIFDAVK